MTMPMDVRAYVKIYDNFLDKDTCKSILETIEANDNWELHMYHDNATNEYKSFDQELSVLDCDDPKTMKLNEKIWSAIQYYYTQWSDELGQWFVCWNGYSRIRYNRYDVNTQMKLHCDHIHTLFDGEKRGIPILSVLGALNDDYDGGELIFWESERINLKAGQIMIFPSNFLYPHKVLPVTKGKRYSYVSWVW